MDLSDRQPVAVLQESPPSWSQRIAPQSSSEVLGNETSVRELMSWLKAWKKKRALLKEAQEPIVAKKRKKSAKKPRKKKVQVYVLLCVCVFSK